MNSKLRGEIRKLPLDAAQSPRNGELMTDRWWVVDDEGLYWYQFSKSARGWAPQCNRNRAIAEDLVRDLYPEARVELIPLVYVGRWDSEYGLNPFANRARGSV